MKTLFAFVLAVMLAACGCATRQSVTKLIKPSQDAALSMYVPIFCDGQPRGTGFPVGPDLIMTAAHVQCDGFMALSLDGQKTWVTNLKWAKAPGGYDVAVIVIPDGLIKEYARFRAPKLGEFVSGYGIAYNGLLSFGVIAQLQPEFLLTNIPIGGMSGSAVLAEDGAVIGIVCFGWPDQRVGGSVSGGHSGELLATLLDSFKAFRTANPEAFK